MLIFDQLKKDDPQLRLVALVVLSGLGMLLTGLWWVQVVSARDYEDSLETQSFRTVRIPAVRGKILDRNGVALAENRPTYNLSLYLGEMRDSFAKEYSRLRPVRVVTNSLPFWRRLLGSELVRTQYVRLKKADVLALTWESRYSAASNAVARIGALFGQNLRLDPVNFQRHYETRLALPYTVVTNLSPAQIALFEERYAGPPGVDLEVQSTRIYPYQTAAAHVLGYLQRDDSSLEGEEAFFSFRLADYRGVIGIEEGYDHQLRGTAGAKSVLVNNVGYRQNEQIWSTAAPGNDVVLTIDLRIQEPAERALQTMFGPNTRGALVVMDVDSGDILALASSPTFDPNDSIRGYPRGELDRRADTKLRPVLNRATMGSFLPGSIFKTVVGMACLDDGLDPKETIENPGYFMVGRRPLQDLASPGMYDFRRALKKSSNTYFITMGLRTGPAKIVQLGQRLHLGERIRLRTNQDAGGSFPSLQRLGSHWTSSDTAYLSIGQGEVSVTPLQMAVLAAAIANGGKVLMPRLVDRVQVPLAGSSEPIEVVPSGQVRDQMGVKLSTLNTLRDAMRADVEDADGTGKAAAVPGMHICGKTGTAQKKNAHGVLEEDTTWFMSFAPYEKPRYAVVVMVEVDSNHASGGAMCAPVAQKIYQALQQRDALPSQGQIARHGVSIP